MRKHMHDMHNHKLKRMHTRHTNMYNDTLNRHNHQQYHRNTKRHTTSSMMYEA